MKMIVEKYFSMKDITETNHLTLGFSKLLGLAEKKLRNATSCIN